MRLQVARPERRLPVVLVVEQVHPGDLVTYRGTLEPSRKLVVDDRGDDPVRRRDEPDLVQNARSVDQDSARILHRVGLPTTEGSLSSSIGLIE